MQPSYAVIAIGLSAVVVLSPFKATAQTDPDLTALSPDREDAPVEDAAKVSIENKPLLDAIAPAAMVVEVQAVPSPAAESTPTQAETNSSAANAADQAADNRSQPQDQDAIASEPSSENQEAIAQTVPPVNQPLPAPADSTTSTPVDTATPLPAPNPTGIPSTLPPSSAPGVAAPEYLFNDPNPLLFPTQPDEVELIGTQPITLEQAIELAQRNSRELQAAQFAVERARAQLRQAEAANLPTVSVGANLASQQVTRTTTTGGTGTGGIPPIILPTPTPSPGGTPTPSPGVTPTPSPGVTPSPTPTPSPGVTPTPSPGVTPTPSPAPLSRQVTPQQQTPEIPGAAQLQTNERLETSLSANLQVEYPLFTAGRRSGQIRAAEGQVRFQELQLEVTAEELRRNVIRDYYSVQESDELVRIAQASVAQNEQSVRDALAQEQAGIGTRFDVLQAQVDLANAQQNLTQRLSDQRIARRQLAARLNLPPLVDISAADPIEVADLWNLSLEDSIVLAFRNRAELQQQLVQREISQQQRRVALSQTGPQVGLFAGYNVQNNLTQGTGFSDSFQFGAQFNMTLFDGGAARANADQEEYNIATAEVQFADTRDQVRFQVEQAFLNLQASFANIQTASLALTQAAESLRLARLRFQAGVGIQSDVLRAQTQLTEAEVNRLQAVLGYNRALNDLRRAVSNFPEANLADSP